MTRFAPQDFYFKEARRLGYVARSAFKLQEVQRRHGVIKRGGAVLDLGCCPGAWLQVACQSLGPMALGGCVVGVDIQPTAVPQRWCDSRVRTIQADAFALSPALLLRLLSSLQPHLPFPPRFSTLLSDMCPSTSGASPSDAAASHSLARRALALAAHSLYTPSEPLTSHPWHSQPPNTHASHTHRFKRHGSHSLPACTDSGSGESRGAGAAAVATAKDPGAVAGADGAAARAQSSGGAAARGQGGEEESRGLAEGPCDRVSAAKGGVLAVGGHMVVKILESEDTPDYVGDCRQLFSSVTRLRPKATRPSSREIYVIAKGFRGVSSGQGTRFIGST
ncbi:hypothetical protein CLOM_g911 [Closterium sp. NIES-68]|nr:hypothetical protein CLOM_g911 [Closterium sp. NIES-68]